MVRRIEHARAGAGLWLCPCPTPHLLLALPPDPAEKLRRKGADWEDQLAGNCPEHFKCGKTSLLGIALGKTSLLGIALSISNAGRPACWELP